MKVLHVIPAVAFRYGGPSRGVLEMCQALSEQGIETELATTNADLNQNLDVLLEKRTLYQGVPTYFFRRSLKGEYKFSWALTRWLKTHLRDYHLIHTHSIFCHPTGVAAHYACKLGVPYLIRPAGMLDHWPMRHKPLRKWFYLNFIERSNLNHARAIHYTSDEEKEASERFGFSSPGVVVPLGIHTDSRPEGDEKGDFRRKYPESRGKKLIVFLSRIDPKKGLELLIEAISELRKTREDFIFVIAGQGEAHYEKLIKQKIKEHCLTEATLFTGFLEGEEKYALLTEADLFLLPSYQENFGLALVEAMNLGRAVLVTRGVHLSRLIEEYQAGLVTNYDKNELARQMNRLLDNEELRKDLGRKAKRLVSERFSWKVVAPQLKALYEKVLAKNVSV